MFTKGSFIRSSIHTYKRTRMYPKNAWKTERYDIEPNPSKAIGLLNLTLHVEVVRLNT